MATSVDETMKLLDEIIARYKPGGEFGKPEAALLKRAKVKSLAETAQGLVTSGLAGTTAGAGAGQRWEEEVGMPAKLQLEDIRSQRLTGAMGAKAGYLERLGERQQQAIEAKRRRQLEAEQSVAARSQANWEASRNYMQDLFGGRGQQTGGGAAPTGGGYGGDYGGAGAYTGAGGAGGAGGVELPSTWGAGYGPMFETGAEAAEAGGETYATGMGGGADLSGAPAHVKSFANYFNYAATLYNKTGRRVESQPAARSALIEMGWRGE